MNDGQTIKTKNVYNALKREGYFDVRKIDTYFIRKNPVRFFVQFLFSVFTTEKYIVLLSQNGRKVLFPVLYFIEKYLHKNVYNYGIGGRLAREVNQKAKWKKYVSNFHGNWMESPQIVEDLARLGVNNAVYIPNFKRLTILKKEEMVKSFDEPYRFVIFSRINKEKGIEDAIAAINSVNHKYNKKIATLDLYGPIEDGYEKRLEQCLSDSDKYCRYCGVVDSEKSVEALKDYYMLLFPTHWRHEGIPGTIIDALTAGVPIISRKWQFCDDMITNYYSGYVYDFESPEDLEKCIEYAISNPMNVIAMKENCLKKAYEYSEEYAMKIIMSELRK